MLGFFTCNQAFSCLPTRQACGYTGRVRVRLFRGIQYSSTVGSLYCWVSRNMASNSKSDVWKYFSIVKEGKNTQCNLCKIFLSYKDGSTSSMRNHIKMKHKSAALGVDVKKQTTLLQFNLSKKKLSTATYESINRSLALFCALDLRPVSLIEGRGFRQFMKKVNPDYQVPCKKTITKYLNVLYEEVKVEMIESISGAIAAFTTDMWTSVAKKGFITVTVHLITEDWRLLTKAIATREVQERHTGENIAALILNLKEEFKIGNLKALVTDNAGNMVCAAQEANLIRVACFAHTLQLAIGDGMNKIPAISKAIAFGRKLVGHFNHSTMSVQALKNHQIKMGVKDPLNVVQDVSTRWNSQFFMVKRLLLLRVSVYGVLLDETVTSHSERDNLAIPEASWKVMEDIVPVLSPLADATEILSMESLPTVSQIFVLLFHLMPAFATAPNDSNVVKDLKNKISAGLRKRFELANDNSPSQAALLTLPVVATLLDPRYKSLKILSEDKKNQLVDYIVQLMESRRAEAPNPSASQSNPAIKTEDHAMSQIMDWLSGDVVDLTETDSSSSEEEVKQYMEEPVRDANPLHWWKHNENKFPNLAKLAKEYLCVPATEVPSERMFSAAGLTVTKLRSTLDPDTVDHILFINKNYDVPSDEEAKTEPPASLQAAPSSEAKPAAPEATSSDEPSQMTPPAIKSEPADQPRLPTLNFDD